MNSNFSEYKNKVPRITAKIPKYWINSSFSSKNIKENRELNKGENESKGIVRLKSDFFIDSRKIKAEKVPIINNIIPGIRYRAILK